jgi:hypothetical protein
MSDLLGTLRTGTSGIVVPGPKATFPAAYQTTSRLTYYATLFNSVEINSTFYRIPQPKRLRPGPQKPAPRLTLPSSCGAISRIPPRWPRTSPAWSAF